MVATSPKFLVLTPEEVHLLLQHTLKHLSRLSNTVLAEAACACLATGELPPGMATPPSPELKQLSEEEHAELASQSQQLAARLPKINLGTPKKRTGDLLWILTVYQVITWSINYCSRPSGHARCLIASASVTSSLLHLSPQYCA